LLALNYDVSYLYRSIKIKIHPPSWKVDMQSPLSQ
jgi:hypothetical protein